MSDAYPQSRLHDVDGDVDPVAELVRLTDDAVISALALAVDADDPRLAKRLAHEASGRLARAAAVLSTIPEGAVAIGHDGQITFVNDTLLAMRGGHADALLGHDPHGVFHAGRGCCAKDRATACALRESLEVAGHRADLHGDLATSGGKPIPVAYAIRPILPGARGTVVLIRDLREELRNEEIQASRMSILEDTTGRAIEEARRRKLSEERLRVLLGAIPDAVLVDGAGRRELANKAAETLFQREGPQLLALPFESLVRGWVPPTAGPSEHQDVLAVRPDGSTVFVDVAMRKVEVDQGTLAVYSIRDVTERKRHERALFENRERLKTVLDTIADGVVVLDMAGRITFANPAVDAIGGRSRSEVLGRAYDDPLWKLRFNSGLGSMFEKITTDGVSIRGVEVDFERADATRRLLAVDAEVIRGPTRRVEAVLVSFRDITEARRLQDDLRQANVDLEARVLERTKQLSLANEELKAFAYSAAHDLKAPLRAIDSIASLIAEDHAEGSREDPAHDMDLLHAEVHRMRRLIDGFLSLSRVTMGEFERKEVDLSHMVRSVFARLQAWEPERRVVLDVEDHLIAKADESFMEILIENLLSNAWKFTSKRTDAVISFKSSVGPAGEIIYHMHDNGVGFDASQAARLFEPFRRSQTAAGFEGNGIGLATVARIVTRHGGRAWAEGTPGRGATFSFTLQA